MSRARPTLSINPIRVLLRSLARLAASAAAIFLCAPGLAPAMPPANDECEDALVLSPGTPRSGTIAGATSNGGSTCAAGNTPDVYFRYTAPRDGYHTFTLCQEGGTAAWDSVVSLHLGCPAFPFTQLACDDDGCRPDGSTAFGFASSLTTFLGSGQEVYVRLATFSQTVAGGAYTIVAVPPPVTTGACCTPSTCAVVTPLSCTTIAGAAYAGDFTVCTPATGPYFTYSAAGVFPRAIPDNAPAGVLSALTVADGFTIGEVEVELMLAHPFIGDLRATLTRGTQQATLLHRAGGGRLGDDSTVNGAYRFFDGAPLSIVDAALGTTGPGGGTVAPGAGGYRAADRLARTVSLRSTFVGTSAAGEWTLSISDNGALDTGSLLGWTLRLRAAGVTGAGACTPTPCPLDINGTFVVDADDIFAFLNIWFAGPPGGTCSGCAADWDGDGFITADDIFAYLNDWFAFGPGLACP